MPQSYFVWKGTDSRSMGLISKGNAPLIRAEERVSHVVVPGRAGDLTLTEGDDVFEPYIQTVPFSVRGAANVPGIFDWLCGEGYLSLSGEPGKQQKARVIGAITLNRVSRNLDNWRGECQFYCQPLKELINPNPYEITSSSTSITNPGDVESRPRITIVGTGDITIRIGTKQLNIYGAESGWKADSETEWVTNSADAPLTGVWSGTFPTIPVGENTVLFTGNVTKLIFEPRWRYR